MSGKNDNDTAGTIYAILLGLTFLGILGFVLTLHFWEKIIYFIYVIDYYVADILNNYFGWFPGYKEINNMVQYADIPKFNFLKMKFEYNIGDNYISYINNFYKPLHYGYAGIILFISYLFSNSFHLKPLINLENNKNYKLRLIEEAKKRLKIFNPRVKLYNNMETLLEKKRFPAELNGTKQFLNADYYLPFIKEEIEADSTENNIIDTNKKYIKDSLFFSNHYINFLFKNIIENNKNEIKNNKTVYSLSLFHNMWKKIKKLILKNNNIQDYYYYKHLELFHNDNIEDFINLIIYNGDITIFNKFLKKYNFNDFELNILEVSENQNEPYTSYIINNDEEIEHSDLEKIVLINKKNKNFQLNLEDIYVYFKILNYNFCLNESYFFNSKEKKVTIPLKEIPPSISNSIEESNKNEIELILDMINQLSFYISKINNINDLQDIIEDYNTFKTSYNDIKNIIIKNTIPKIERIVNKKYIVIEKDENEKPNEQLISFKKIINNDKYLNYLLNKDKIELIEYIKIYKKFIKLSIIKLKEIEEAKIDLEELKKNYKTLIEPIKLLFKDRQNFTYNEEEKRYLTVLNEKILDFITTMINKIELYYKYNLEYDSEEENSLHPEIGQLVMPYCYILTPFLFELKKEKQLSQNQKIEYFKMIENFNVKGYKKYIYPVFEEIYNNWYGNIDNLMKYYKQKIIENKRNLEIEKKVKEEMNLKLNLLKEEAEKQINSQSSIETKLLNIFEIHKFEETIIIALWKEFTKLENLPTTKLSNLKYDNFILWYALTSIGDIDNTQKNYVIGRPFDFNAGLPILLMYELEIKEYEERKKIKPNISELL